MFTQICVGYSVVPECTFGRAVRREDDFLLLSRYLEPVFNAVLFEEI